MAQKAKFLFDYSFDERAHGDAAPDATAAAKQARLQAELDAAYARGHEAGLAEAAASVSQRVADAVAAMTEQLTVIERARAEIEQSTTKTAIHLALAVLRKILPSVERRIALPEIETVFADCIHRVLDEPRIVFRVPDNLLDALQGRNRRNRAARRLPRQGGVVGRRRPRHVRLPHRMGRRRRRAQCRSHLERRRGARPPGPSRTARSAAGGRGTRRRIRELNAEEREPCPRPTRTLS